MASNPIIPIINGIADALHEINKDAKIYTTTPDNVKKNDAGYFYIKGPISLNEMRFLKDLHQLRLTFDVMFFPPDMDAADAGLMSSAAYAMSEALYEIQPGFAGESGYGAIGNKKRGWNRSTTNVDGVVHVTTSYDLWLTTPQNKEVVKSIAFSFAKPE